jgi:hypothetical protein
LHVPGRCGRQQPRPDESHSPDSAKTGTPITNIYAAERFSRHAIEAITSAITRFGVFD